MMQQHRGFTKEMDDDLEMMADVTPAKRPALERAWSQLTPPERNAAAALGWKTEPAWGNQETLVAAPRWRGSWFSRCRLARV